MPKKNHPAVSGDASARPEPYSPRDLDSVLAGAPLERVWRIHIHLSRESRVTATTLASELGVTARTIKRDIEIMKDRLGLPIEWEPGERSYVYTRPCDTLPLLRLDAREALALALAGRLFDRWHGSPHGRMFSSVIGRIAPIFGGVLSVAIDSIDRALTAPRADGPDEIGHLLTLLEAALGRRVVLIDYLKPGASRAETRRVNPLHLANLEGQWILLAHAQNRKATRNFRLTRIQSIRTTEEIFEPPDNFDARAYLRGCLGRFASDAEYEVRIALDAHAAIYAKENPWHPSQQMAELADGRTEIVLHLNHLADARAAVLRWGEHAEVLAPGELRTEVHASLRKALGRYGG